MKFEEHNRMVEKLWKDLSEGRNERIPVWFSFDEQFKLSFYECTFSEYYQDPKLQMDVQLETERWIREKVLHDQKMGPPERWTIFPVYPEPEPSFLGCEIMINENDYGWAKPILKNDKSLLKEIDISHPEEKVKREKVFKYYQIMKRETKKRKFAGRPINVYYNSSGSNGPFILAATVRGISELCLDFYDDPDFVKELLALSTRAILERIKIWCQITNLPLSQARGVPVSFEEQPGLEGWGISDDNCELISDDSYRKFVLPFHKILYSEMAEKRPRWFHLCGHAQHLFKTLYQELGITTFDGPGPFIDLVKMRKDLGKEVKINLRMDTNVLRNGPADLIEEMVKELLKDEVKGGGKLELCGYVLKGTPLEHLEVMYEAGLKYGKLER